MCGREPLEVETTNGQEDGEEEGETQAIRDRASNWHEAAILIRKKVGKTNVITDLHRVPDTREGEVTWEYKAKTRAKRIGK